ncbi:MAG: SDR family oxidoreductase [Pyrinomonadaceae bacterium]|nr:SDR family oxidoreductase [Phycisphaerales bacterium]
MNSPTTPTLAIERSVPPGKLAIITGASSGIGKATALLLAQRGFRTIVIARRADLLGGLATQLSAYAPSRAVPLDLSQPDRIMEVLGPVIASEGTPSVLVNGAGFGLYAPYLEQSPEDIDLLVKVNFLAPAAIIRAVLPSMLKAAKGGEPAHIFNVCSVSARLGPWGHAGYSAAKSALRSLTETLECEHGQHGVHFTVVYPGIIKTEFFVGEQMKALWSKVARRAIPPERVARAIVRTLGKRRISLYVPAHYRGLDLIAAISPNFALKMVRDESRPSRN